MSVDWMEFIVASVAVILAPGPGSVFVAKTAAVGGTRAGYTAMLGILLGDTCLIVLSLLGVSALFSAYLPLFHAVRLAGAGYLIFLGLQSIFTKSKKRSVAFQNYTLPLWRAFTITLLNPKAVFFFMVFFPIFISSADAGLVITYIDMTLLFMGVSVTYLCVVSHISAKVGLAFQENTTIQSIARKVCGCLLIGFGIKVAISSR